ncbi:MAG TPA: NADPH:quinone oxidoreductase family protein [Acidimicrobiia bacterium]|nr:NADPH:quinone oxidoreductase family protein [Acidimicrobiia bacterium]
MRALICSRLDGIDSLEVGELPAPELRPGTVRVAVGASAVNFPDLLLIVGRYQEQPPLPFSPGMEVAGTVVEVAEDVEDFAVGDRVLGMIGHGGFAEEVVVSPDALVPMPADVRFEEAAAFPIAHGTSYHALVDRASLRDGETLLVLGAAGGVGLAAVQIGKALGARVLAAVSSDDKERAVGRAGADGVIRYDRHDLREALRDAAPDGVDVVYDPVGGEMTEPAFRSLAWRGRHLVVGFASGSIPALPANLALLKGASLVGVFWGRFTREETERNRANFTTLFEWWKEGRVAPLVSEVFPLERSIDALRKISERGAIGRLVVRP